MKQIIRKIDRSLKRLYNLDFSHRAEDFILETPWPIPVRQVATAHEEFKGALYVENHDLDNLSIGIYLSAPLREVLTHLERRRKAWTHRELSAFVVATEEISHFNYLLFNGTLGRAVSQFELELQAEVDKFAVAYFALHRRVASRKELGWFLYEQFFQRFHLAPNLSDEQSQRYTDANRSAKQFVAKLIPTLLRKPERALKKLRDFYQDNCAEKISLCNKD